MTKHHKFCSMMAGPHLTCSCGAFLGTINPDTKPNSQAVLAVRMQPNDADAETVRDYLIKILLAVVSQGEGFSTKRPFGNSGWELDIPEALVRVGYLEGTLDEDDCLDTWDRQAGREMIAAAIQALR